jgi:hypothetical protein
VKRLKIYIEIQKHIKYGMFEWDGGCGAEAKPIIKKRSSMDGGAVGED